MSRRVRQITAGVVALLSVAPALEAEAPAGQMS